MRIHKKAWLEFKQKYDLIDKQAQLEEISYPKSIKDILALEPKPLILQESGGDKVSRVHKVLDANSKYLMTPDTLLVEKLGDPYVIEFTRYFTLWTGAFSPFFEVEPANHPEDPAGYKVAKQIRPLPIKDPGVCS